MNGDTGSSCWLVRRSLAVWRRVPNHADRNLVAASAAEEPKQDVQRRDEDIEHAGEQH